MRIVYTNLKEDDAGVKRSVRQFRVEFDGTGGRPVVDVLPLAVPALAAPDARRDAERPRKAQAPETADASYRQQMTTPPEGMYGLRSIFIKKFVDTQTGVRAGREGSLSITV